MKIIHKIIIPITIIATLFAMNSVSALSYQSSELVSFTFNPTVQITISDNLTIPSLSPGDSKDSNIITVTAASNSIAGYTLSSTVGSTSNPSTELRKDGTSATHKFSSITTNAPTLSDFTGNDWGYSYSTDSGTTWQNGDITGTPATGYNGLPLYTTETPIKLINTTTSDTSSIQFKIGASATSTQVAGEYTNVINFIGVANPNPPTFDNLFLAAGKTKYNGYYTMQDMNATICNNALQGSTTQLIDIRDGEVYMISKLKDDNCWMLDNLRLGSNEPITLTNRDTNIATETWTLPASVGAGYSYDRSMINVDYKNDIASNYGGVGSNENGVYYNYCAASAGSYCYSKSTTVDLPDTLIDVPYDVCPINWRMPTGSSEGEYTILYGIYGGLAMGKALSASLTGFYSNEGLSEMNIYGFYWTSTCSESLSTHAYMVRLSGNSIGAGGMHYRYRGQSVRCIAK